MRVVRSPDVGDGGHRFLHASKLPLTVWFLAAFLMATHSNGISALPALQLQAQLGLGSHRTAWMLAAKLRRAMLAPGRHPLASLVEVDGSSLPLRTKDDPPAGGQGRSHDGKILIVGAIDVNDGKPGRLERLSRRPRRQPRPARHRPDGRPYRPAVGPSRLRQPENLGARRLPRPG